MSMRTIVQAAEPTHEIGALLVGGFYGTWISADDMGWISMDNVSLRPIGSGLGCGAVIASPRSVCGLIETARVVTWLAGETAGQCGPCVHGLAALARGMTDLATTRAPAEIVTQLQRWAGQIEGRGACSFPDGAVRLVRSALRVFAADIAHHVHHGPCAAAVNRSMLKIPATVPDREKVWR